MHLPLYSLQFFALEIISGVLSTGATGAMAHLGAQLELKFDQLLTTNDLFTTSRALSVLERI